MIFGINFNGTQIPDGIKRKFPARVKMPGLKRGKYAELKGIGQSEQERDVMLITAHNGRRTHVETRRFANGENWYGIYTY